MHVVGDHDLLRRPHPLGHKRRQHVSGQVVEPHPRHQHRPGLSRPLPVLLEDHPNERLLPGRIQVVSPRLRRRGHQSLAMQRERPRAGDHDGAGLQEPSEPRGILSIDNLEWHPAELHRERLELALAPPGNQEIGPGLPEFS